ncbi:hypothetical protein TBLA_0B09720 [Henningerozyma blattae CBS 6284]|uniref:Ketoreductase (KR) domain-containing protein n=1 Tax=Henningerozyma blattae (strain ATCC 34711 / CBS 6284 / DSM 70876 / NBRC 10599 / NRRL Y-10934 / UCD 77-7) TaxID=1071380 RepID=I2H086_HENB6|nr:hypothetical protein TBLA_0B09720 [Tetrapisispora blattae CBS 6284]CCH59788.1 hypothetical protein TBLA_0B09720 [Tetrapisispora blattae CBS 6284]
MPLNFLGAVLTEGTSIVPYWKQVKTITPYVLGASAIKYWASGGANKWERNLHGKVYIVTGSTSQGMGTSAILDLARRGAQLILLTRNLDEWTIDWCNDIREQSGNELIYLEECDLSDLLDVRNFATTWLNNSPPRRLDGILVMSGEMEPCLFSKRKSSIDGLELQIATNFAGVFHLLDLMKPSFKAQPPDRDVRIIVTTCLWQSMGRIDVEDPLWQNRKFDGSLKYFATSKLQLSLCMLELQRRLMRSINEEKKGKDTNTLSEHGANVSVTLVQPGIMRSNSLRRIISNGSIILLIFLYCIILYPLLWLFTKSGRRGAENIIYAVMTPELEPVNRTDLEKVKYIVDCEESKLIRKEFQDEELQKHLYDKTASDILELEKAMAKKRPMKKKANYTDNSMKVDKDKVSKERASNTGSSKNSTNIKKTNVSTKGKNQINESNLSQNSSSVRKPKKRLNRRLLINSLTLN